MDDQPICAVCRKPLRLRPEATGEYLVDYEPCAKHPNGGWAIPIDWRRVQLQAADDPTGAAHE